MSNSEFRVEYQRNKPTKRQSYRIVRERGQRGFPTRQWPRSARSAEEISVGISIVRVSNRIVRVCYSENRMFRLL